MTMLDRMRRHKNILKWTLALVVLTLSSSTSPISAERPDRAGAAPREVIAEVGGHELTAGEFQQRYRADAGYRSSSAATSTSSCCDSSASSSRSCGR